MFKMFKKKARSSTGFKIDHVLVPEEPYVRASQREGRLLKNRIKNLFLKKWGWGILFLTFFGAYYFGLDWNFVFGMR